jgi:outer membrane protein TolC
MSYSAESRHKPNAGSRARVHSNLRAILGAAVDDERIAKNPLLRTVRPTAPAAGTPPVALDTRASDRLAAARLAHSRIRWRSVEHGSSVEIERLAD